MQRFASLRVFQRVGVLRRKILRRCVFSKRVVCYDARFCVAACVQNGLVYYDARFCIAVCVSKRLVLRRKICVAVCSKEGGCYDARFASLRVFKGWCITTQDFASLLYLNDRSYLVSFFSQQFDDAFFFTSKVAGTYGKRWVLFGKGYDLRNPSFVPAIEEQVFREQDQNQRQQPN